MQSAGLIAIDPGHYIESLCKERFIEKFETWKQEENWDIDFSFLKRIQTHFNLIKGENTMYENLLPRFYGMSKQKHAPMQQAKRPHRLRHKLLLHKN